MDKQTAKIVDNLPDFERNVSEDLLISQVQVAGYVLENDETNDDSFFYLSQFGHYLQEINCGDLKIAGDSICQWAIYCYVTFLQSASVTCCSWFSHLAIIIFDMYNSNVGRYYARNVAKVYFNNFSKLYFLVQVRNFIRSYSN